MRFGRIESYWVSGLNMENKQELRKQVKALRERERSLIEKNEFGLATHAKIVADFIEDYLT